VSGIIRPVVAASWFRCEQLGAPRDELPPIIVTKAAAVRGCKTAGLDSVRRIAESVLLDFARYAGQVVALADASGLVRWVGGNPDTLRSAERIHLIPGAQWTEEAAGTNAIGTALLLDHPVQIFSAEHYKRRLHAWSAAAAPVHHPESGEKLGVLSLAGPLNAAHPHGFSLVVAASRMVESDLRHEADQRDERLKAEYMKRALEEGSADTAVINCAGRVLLSTPHGWLGSRVQLSADGRPSAPSWAELEFEPTGDGFFVRRVSAHGPEKRRSVLRLEALGRTRVRGTAGSGREFSFTPRHGEIMVILAHRPAGLDEDELLAALYSDGAKKVTLRAEISRLRKLLGSMVKTRPYRLAADVSADFLEVQSSIACGDASTAARLYTGTLLPGSSAPGVHEIRGSIEAAIRPAVDGASI